MEDGLKEKYPDYQDYWMFHVLAGSGSEAFTKKPTKFDFPGEDSIVLFIETFDLDKFAAEVGDKSPSGLGDDVSEAPTSSVN